MNMKINMKEKFMMDKQMEKELKLIKMEEYLLENLKIIREKVMENY